MKTLAELGTAPATVLHRNMEIRDATVVMQKVRPVTGLIALERAPVRLRIDLGALEANWRDLARRAAPGAAPPSSRPMPTGSGSPKPPRRCGTQARARSLSPT